MHSILQLLLLSSVLRVSFSPFKKVSSTLMKFLGRDSEASEQGFKATKEWEYQKVNVDDKEDTVPGKNVESEPLYPSQDQILISDPLSLKPQLVSISETCKRAANSASFNDIHQPLQYPQSESARCSSLDLDEYMIPLKDNPSFYTCLLLLPVLNKCSRIQLFPLHFCLGFNSKTHNQRLVSFRLLISRLSAAERIYLMNIIYFLKRIFYLNGKRTCSEFLKILDYFSGYVSVTNFGGVRRDSIEQTMFPPLRNGKFLKRYYKSSEDVRVTLIWIIETFDLKEISDIFQQVLQEEESNMGAQDPAVNKQELTLT
ncbi:hypothetical protein RF11_15269 [Thelohanellus kitauei]|uniref:Uncharacterized protein n=1 Tax=Thelohanellus kitauei TaxID=669202 RepID=A0A0C2MI75_THEKT|nr:hypothetical protein RF11_15269 [Thelohanellus kitauei]